MFCHCRSRRGGPSRVPGPRPATIAAAAAPARNVLLFTSAMIFLLSLLFLETAAMARFCCRLRPGPETTASSRGLHEACCDNEEESRHGSRGIGRTAQLVHRN